MGIATLMIIACHAPASGVLMPRVISCLFTLGNYGVDIFLFLSGLGLSYSMNKLETNGGGHFYLVQKEILENTHTLPSYLCPVLFNLHVAR